jgi:hypothetical protein
VLLPKGLGVESTGRDCEPTKTDGAIRADTIPQSDPDNTIVTVISPPTLPVLQITGRVFRRQLGYCTEGWQHRREAHVERATVSCAEQRLVRWVRARSKGSTGTGSSLSPTRVKRALGSKVFAECLAVVRCGRDHALWWCGSVSAISREAALGAVPSIELVQVGDHPDEAPPRASASVLHSRWLLERGEVPGSRHACPSPDVA